MADDDRTVVTPTPGDTPCPVCGYLNTPQTTRCGVCGHDLTTGSDEANAGAAGGEQDEG